HGHGENLGTVEEAIGVIFQSENRWATVRFVSPHSFECAHPVMQGMGKHMHLGVTPGNQFAIQPDNTVSISHRHGSYSPQLASTRRPQLSEAQLKKAWAHAGRPSITGPQTIASRSHARLHANHGIPCRRQWISLYA